MKKRKKKAVRFSRVTVERCIERLRSDLYGYNDPVSKSGKTIHPHPVFSEKIEPADQVMMSVLEEAASKGYAQHQFSLGKQYLARGDTAKADYWLGKAAAQQYQEAIALLREIHSPV